MKNILGPRVALLRGERGLTQEAFAEKLQGAGLDMNRTSVAKIETRQRAVIDYELVVLAHVLGVAVADLLPTMAVTQAQIPSLLGNSRGRAKR